MFTNSRNLNNICGFGVYLTFPDGTSLKHCDACGVNCSNFDAEIIAITSAIKTVHQSFEDRKRDPCDLVIFKDSKSTLQAPMDVSGSNDTNIVQGVSFISTRSKIRITFFLGKIFSFCFRVLKHWSIGKD